MFGVRVIFPHSGLGKKAHQIGKAHKWTREEARFAGRLSQFIQGHTKDI